MQRRLERSMFGRQAPDARFGFSVWTRALTLPSAASRRSGLVTVPPRSSSLALTPCGLNTVCDSNFLPGHQPEAQQREILRIPTATFDKVGRIQICGDNAAKQSMPVSSTWQTSSDGESALRLSPCSRRKLSETVALTLTVQQYIRVASGVRCVGSALDCCRPEKFAGPLIAEGRDRIRLRSTDAG